MARAPIEDAADILDVNAMYTEVAIPLLKMKLKGHGRNLDPNDTARLVRQLGHIPVAITQAVVDINPRAPRVTVSKYCRNWQAVSTSGLGSCKLMLGALVEMDTEMLCFIPAEQHR